MKFEKIQNYLIRFFIFLIPLFFLPLTRDFFDFNKNLLLMFFALVLLLLFLVKTAFNKKLVFKYSSFDFPMVLLFAATLLSLFFVTPNKVDSLLIPGASGTFIALILVYFLLRQFSPTKKTVIYPLAASAAVSAFVAIVQFFHLLEKLPIADFYKNQFFNPAGAPFGLLTFFTVVFVMLSIILYNESGKKIKTDYQNILLLVSLVLILGAIVINLVLISKEENRPFFLPYSYGWSIGFETLKKPLNGLLGVGNGNFVNAFDSYKPVIINQKELWSFRFASSSNFYLQVLTELGLLGLASFVLLLINLFKFKNKSGNICYFGGAFLILTAILFLPASFLLLFLLFLFLSLISSGMSKSSFVFPKLPAESEKEYLVQAYNEKSALKPDSSQILFVIAPFFILAFSAVYFLGRAWNAEFLMAKGMVQAAKGNAQLTYDLQRDAVLLNPYFSTYRVIFSQTNFALAALVSQKQDLTDIDKQNLSQLITQSINNAKSAINLNPSSTTWENLADLYKRLINVNAEAANWSIIAYNQAISLDPVNPLLRVVLGQLLYSLQAYDLAIRQFEIAVTIKDDFANGWYNLANSYREKGDIKQARLAYNKTLSFVEEGTNDFERVKAEIDALPEEPEESIVNQNLETLTSPASPSAQIDQKVELNEKEVAPEVSITPEPLATESAELSPSEPEL